MHGTTMKFLLGISHGKDPNSLLKYYKVEFVADNWVMKFSGKLTFLLLVIISINSTSKDSPHLV